MGGMLRGFAVRMEGRCAPILATLSTFFRLKLALWEDPEQLAAMVHLFDLRFLLLGYLGPEGHTPGSLEMLERLRQTQTFANMPCVLTVRALEWAAYEKERELHPPSGSVFLIDPDTEFDPELPHTIAAWLREQTGPVLEWNLNPAPELRIGTGAFGEGN